MPEKRKVKLIQKYTFEIIHYEDGHSVMKRTNDNFSVIELLGVTEIIKENLMCVMKDSVTKTNEVNINSTNSPIIHK